MPSSFFSGIDIALEIAHVLHIHAELLIIEEMPVMLPQNNPRSCYMSWCCRLTPPHPTPPHAVLTASPPPRDALEGKAPQGRPQKRLDRRSEEVAKSVGGGYCRLQMPLKLAVAARET